MNEDSITMLDSEALMLATWHAREAAKLSFQDDYGKKWEKHMERQEKWSDWLDRSIQQRQAIANGRHSSCVGEQEGQDWDF